MWLRHASRIPRRARVGVLEDTLGNHSRAEPWHKAAIDRGAFLAARHTSQSRGHAPPDTTL